MKKLRGQCKIVLRIAAGEFTEDIHSCCDDA